MATEHTDGGESGQTIALLGIPLELGAADRGAIMGPAALRTAVVPCSATRGLFAFGCLKTSKKVDIRRGRVTASKRTLDIDSNTRPSAILSAAGCT